MVQGIDNAIKLYRDADLPYWRLYEGWEMKPTNCIAESKGSDSMTDKTSSEGNLRDILQMQQPGKYLLSVREKFNSNQSGVNIKFDIPFTNGMVPYNTSAIGNVTAPIGFVHRSEMELALVKKENEYAIKDLERKFEEFTKKKEPKQTALDIFLEKHGGILIGALMSRFAPGATAQVGLQGFTEAQQQPIQQTEVNGVPQTTDQKLEWVINTLAQKEGSNDAAVELLYRFTHYTIQNPEQYQMFKPMILKTEPTHE